jgi:hypothetical protein
MEETMQNYLMQVEEGMRVYDREHHELGKVERIQLSDDNPGTPEVEAATPGDINLRRDSIIDNIAEAFTTDELPVAVQARLLQHGFIRIHGAGLFAADRYVTPDQILSVSGDEVVLKVSKNELLKKH